MNTTRIQAQANETSDGTVNTIRLYRGTEFRRYEMAKGCSVATLHTNASQGTMDVADAHAEIGRYMVAGEGWRVATV